MLNLSSLFGRGLLIHIFAYSILLLYISFLKGEVRNYDAKVSTLKAHLATEKEYTKIETPKTDDCLSKLKFYDTLLLEFSNGNYSK